MKIGKRFRKERVRLELTQSDLCSLLGVSRQVIHKYENDLAVPGGIVLSKFTRQGADIQYVLTGIRSTNEPTQTDIVDKEIETDDDDHPVTIVELGNIGAKWYEAVRELNKDERTAVLTVAFSATIAKFIEIQSKNNKPDIQQFSSRKIRQVERFLEGKNNGEQVS